MNGSASGTHLICYVSELWDNKNMQAPPPTQKQLICATFKNDGPLSQRCHPSGLLLFPVGTIKPLESLEDRINRQNISLRFAKEVNTYMKEASFKPKLQQNQSQMQNSSGRANDAKEKAPKSTNLSANPTAKAQGKPKSIISDNQALKILEEVERLLTSSENLEAINLLRALKDNMQNVKSPSLHILTIVNLGILYYQVGFLEQANEQFTQVIAKLKDASSKALPHRSKDVLRMRYETMLGKLQLQICILYSEMGKHDLALEHAKLSSKYNYNLIYDVLAKLYANLNKLLVAKNYQKKQGEITIEQGRRIINNIAILNHLTNCTKDLKLAFVQKERLTILEEQTQITRRFGSMNSKIDIDMLYELDDQADHMWIYKNKILDQIQLIPYTIDEFEDLDPEITRTEVIEKITFLAISLYCYSTETRFIEKQKNCDSNDVLDSQHWLSRSLEIAYSFMPPQAPILNQILTVHDRFHGLDKQTIPEDEQVTGFFKVLKPLSKPKSNYSSKNPGCSPIMIRIQADKVDVRMEGSKTQREESSSRNMFELDTESKQVDLQTLTKNNKIRGFSHGNKRVQTTEVHSARGNLSSRATIDTPLSINGNIRSNYVSKRFSKKKDDKMRMNYSELNGKAVIGEDLLFRPPSYEKESIKEEEQHRSASERRKKSLPVRKLDHQKRPNSIGATIKFEGLQLKGQKMQDVIEGQFFERMHHDKVVEATRLGGNVYINNNINLYISKNVEMNPFGQTFVRGQITQDKSQSQEGTKGEKNKEKELSRRQIFLNKRRANNFIGAQQF